MAKQTEDPFHPIIDRPWDFEIVELCYARELGDPRSARLDLTLQSGSEVVRLRFLGVEALSIEEGFPCPTHGLCIIDISRRQLDGIQVLVTDFEASQGAIRFWARDVVNRDCDV